MQEKQTKKKPWLVDVPVCMQIWIRPELQRQTFEPIRQARPSVLFLVSDGGRNEEEWEKIRECRRICEQGIDWECTVHKLYMTENHGLYTMFNELCKFVFAHADRMIFFEDDTLADPSFFRFCAELLEKYKDDTRVDAIMGMNFFGQYDKPTADYFFCRMGMTTGSAIWKRSYDLWAKQDWMSDPYILSIIAKEREFGKKAVKQTEELLATGMYDNHLPGPEFFGHMQKVTENQLTIVPTKNMVRQMGATSDAAHAVDLKMMDKKTQRYYTAPIYACQFPLKCTDYVVRDVEYEKMVDKWRNNKIENAFRRGVTICKRVWYGDGKILWQKFVDRVIKRKKEIET